MKFTVVKIEKYSSRLEVEADSAIEANAKADASHEWVTMEMQSEITVNAQHDHSDILDMFKVMKVNGNADDNDND